MQRWLISISHTNVGIILIPNSTIFNEEDQSLWFLAADYNVKSDEGKKKIDLIFSSNDSDLVQKLNNAQNTLEGETKPTIIESSVGLPTLIVFIAIYLGVIFLIVSCPF